MKKTTVMSLRGVVAPVTAESIRADERTLCLSLIAVALGKLADDAVVIDAAETIAIELLQRLQPSSGGGTQ